MEGKILYTHGTIVNICMVYELISTLNYFDATLENHLFGAVKLIKNTDVDGGNILDMVLGFMEK